LGIDFGALIVDLEELVSNSKEDFTNEFWSSYESYVKTYNKLLTDIQSLGFYKKLKLIKSVPLSEQSFESGYSKQEKAKLREITIASKILLRKIKLLLSLPNVPSYNREVRSSNIFLVYENNNEMKVDVVNKLEQLELNPIILHEKSDSTRSFFDSIKKYPHISFVIFIFSRNNPRGKNNLDLIFKLGFFTGKLGAENVVVVYQKDDVFKILKDNYDILWIEYKIDWYLGLIKQLKSCNFDIDANKIGWL
jgi:hypothetical protein